MKRSTLACSVAACLGLAVPVLAAEPPTTGSVNHPPSREKTVAATKPVAKCLSDLRAFDRQMAKDGYWLGGFGYGYGYPMSGYPANTTAAYLNARPGYEVRILVASATILAGHGQQQACEKVLAITRDAYKTYVADMRSGKLPVMDLMGLRDQLLAAAKSVTDRDTSFRSDELLGTDVLNPQNVGLGSIEDLVLSPQTGKIAYLVIARGGVFGIDRRYVPIPWADFKITPNVNLLVLDAGKGTMAAAPEVSRDEFTLPGQFDQESKKVDTYWNAHLSTTGSN